jgi:hypothetical protein
MVTNKTYLVVADGVQVCEKLQQRHFPNELKVRRVKLGSNTTHFPNKLKVRRVKLGSNTTHFPNELN